jgi:hypothetical protein
LYPCDTSFIFGVIKLLIVYTGGGFLRGFTPKKEGGDFSVFGYASGGDDGKITFQKKLLLCTDGKKGYSFELSGEEIITGTFIINGTKAKYDDAIHELVSYMHCVEGCKEFPSIHHQSIKMTLDILAPRALISPYDTFKITLNLE